MAKEVSPKEYDSLVASGKVSKSSQSNYINPAVIASIVILLCGVSFVAGEGYQKGHSKVSAKGANGQLGPQGMAGPGRFGNRQRPTVGQVTAIAEDSITVNNDRTGSSQTFKVTASTTVDNNGTTASPRDIKAGDTVFVQTTTGDASTASRIVLNPSMKSPSSSAQPSAQDNTLTN